MEGMITDKNGNTYSDWVAREQPKQKRRDYKPAPGRVTVIREKINDHYVADEQVNIVKPTMAVEFEEVFSIFATVARIGDPIPGTMAPFFKKGDVVSIIPGLFTEVQLPGGTVWQGPWSAVSGVFCEIDENASDNKETDND